jgi:hypothetical protein
MNTIVYAIVDIKGKVEFESLFVVKEGKTKEMEKMEVRFNLLAMEHKNDLQNALFNQIDTFSQNNDISFKRIYLN